MCVKLRREIHEKINPNYFAAFCIVFSTTLAFADNIGININGVSVPFTDTTGSPFIDNTNHTQVP